MTDTIPVRFSGCEERDGPLSRGQENILRALLTGPDQVAEDLVLDLPPGTTVERLAGALRLLLIRHESLRTRYDIGPGRWAQRVAAAGDLALRVVRCDASRSRLAAEQLRHELWLPRFDLEKDLPLRVAVVVSGTECLHLAAAISHLATDGIGLGLMVGDLRALLAGEELSEQGLQPIDLAALEARPEIDRRIRGSRRYWADQLGKVPQAVFPLEAEGGEALPQPGILLRSRSAAEALRKIASRTGTSRSAAVLSALTVLLARYAGVPSIGLTSSASNRILPQLRNYAGTQSTDAFIHVDITGAECFDEVARRVAKGALLAYRNSWYDAREIWEEISEAGRVRGIDAYTRDCLFNDVSAAGHSPELRHSATPDPVERFPDGNLTVLEPEWRLSRMALTVYRLEGEFTASLWTDPRCLPRAELHSFGRDLVQTLVRAGESITDLSKLVSEAELAPAGRGPDWHFIDRSWVRLGVVRRLLENALGHQEFLLEIKHSATGSEETVIVCHAVDRKGSLTPELLHSTCLDLLPGRSAAMTPHSYNLYAQAPDDLGDPMAWRQLTAFAQGTGR
ncbi:Condensation domain-containing protein [Sinosporangium album]|uniref:Condensation domain-containing protein n=1 Tax=Sinosporangium album TaxID=504805 RepID=A0A1G8A6D3_9ACTN|nr:condensation domain-containing protein [Sinosporangium album]SDH16512.1 Condensation domain-containing protein [Sinosporangium album]